MSFDKQGILGYTLFSNEDKTKQGILGYTAFLLGDNTKQGIFGYTDFVQGIDPANIFHNNMIQSLPATIPDIPLTVYLTLGSVRFSGIIYESAAIIAANSGLTLGSVDSQQAFIIPLDDYPVSGLSRYDAVSIGADRVIDITKGTESTIPVPPTIPDGNLLCIGGNILIYQGMKTGIIRLSFSNSHWSKMVSSNVDQYAYIFNYDTGCNELLCVNTAGCIIKKRLGIFYEGFIFKTLCIDKLYNNYLYVSLASDTVNRIVKIDRLTLTVMGYSDISLDHGIFISSCCSGSQSFWGSGNIITAVNNDLIDGTSDPVIGSYGAPSTEMDMWPGSPYTWSSGNNLLQLTRITSILPPVLLTGTISSGHNGTGDTYEFHVIGVGTQFLSEVQVGDRIGNSTVGTKIVLQVVDDTHMVMDSSDFTYDWVPSLDGAILYVYGLPNAWSPGNESLLSDGAGILVAIPGGCFFCDTYHPLWGKIYYCSEGVGMLEIWTVANIPVIPPNHCADIVYTNPVVELMFDSIRGYLFVHGIRYNLSLPHYISAIDLNRAFLCRCPSYRCPWGGDPDYKINYLYIQNQNVSWTMINPDGPHSIFNSTTGMICAIDTQIKNYLPTIGQDTYNSLILIPALVMDFYEQTEPDTVPVPYIPPPPPTPVLPPSSYRQIQNLEWIRYFYILPGQIQYYYFIAENSGELNVFMESADTLHNYNADMVVKYVGPDHNDALIPTIDDYNYLIAHMSGGITNDIVINGYHYFINHASSSYETIAIPRNAAGCYYIMLYYPDVSDPAVMLNLGVGW
jgi:hypothetical protein